MLTNHLILCHHLLLMPSAFPSIGSFPVSRLFASGGQGSGIQLQRGPSSEYEGLTSFRNDCFLLLAVQGTLKCFLPHHNLKASIPWHSAFFMVQLSHPYMTTGKAIALTRWIFVGKVMSLFFNVLSRLVITCLSRSKRLLISWLQPPSVWYYNDKYLPLYICQNHRMYDTKN